MKSLVFFLLMSYYRIACAKLLRIGSIPSTFKISLTLAFFSRMELVRRIKYLKKKTNIRGFDLSFKEFDIRNKKYNINHYHKYANEI